MPFSSTYFPFLRGIFLPSIVSFYIPCFIVSAPLLIHATVINAETTVSVVGLALRHHFFVRAAIRSISLCVWERNGYFEFLSNVYVFRGGFFLLLLRSVFFFVCSRSLAGLAILKPVRFPRNVCYQPYVNSRNRVFSFSRLHRCGGLLARVCPSVFQPAYSHRFSVDSIQNQTYT